MITTHGKRGRKPKYTHTLILDNVNAREIYKNYKNVFKDADTSASCNNMHIDDRVVPFDCKTQYSNFFYESHNTQTVTMIDYVNYGCLPERTDMWCAHDHHPFNTSPIGVPIAYMPNKQNTTDKDYFLTTGIFCSFSCCLAFINEHRHEFLYRNSKQLLYALYYRIYQTNMDILPAPSWETLKVHGGHLSIDEFRKSFCQSNFIITPNIKRPYMVCVGKYIDERRCGYT